MHDLIVLQGCRTINLTQGKLALIDEQDWPEASCWMWHALRDKRGAWYAGRTGGFTLHRQIHDDPEAPLVDHRDGDGLNNTRENLRSCTFAQNGRNQRRACGSSRFKGVFWNGRDRRWIARIGGGGPARGGERIHLGSYRVEEDAARAYDRAAVERYGEFATTNRDLFGDY